MIEDSVFDPTDK